MLYDISEFINPKDPIYVTGCSAIQKRDIQKLEEILNCPEFDSASFEACALLFFAAENAYIDAFHKLGDAGVLLFNPLKILKKRPHILSDETPCSNVYLIQDSTPLHTMLKHLNLRAYEKLNLSEHFKQDDIERTLNTYSLKAKGTPLDIAWKNYTNSTEFLIKQAQRNNEDIALIPTDFFHFSMEALSLIPDITAPTLVEEPLLYQKAIHKNDILTLHIISTLTVYTLNHICYKYPKQEYEILYPLTEPEIAKQMQKNFTEEKTAPKTHFIGKAKEAFIRLFEHQKS